MSYTPHPVGVRGFAFPLIRPSSAYDELGLDATATDRQIGAAVASMVHELERDAAKVKKELDAVVAAVPGYCDLLAQEAELLKKNPTAGVPASLKRQLAEMREIAFSRTPDFARNHERSRQIQAAIKHWRDLSLDNPEQRKKYERKHPPLALLKIRECSRTSAADRRVMLRTIRKEVAAFLESRGEAVFHPSDLTRHDFSGDYQPNDLLDPPEESA